MSEWFTCKEILPSCLRIPSFFHGEAPGFRRREVRDYCERIRGSAARPAGAVLRRGGQTCEPKDRVVCTVWLGQLDFCGTGRLRAPYPAVSIEGEEGAGS